ncbi:MAG: hypothetical protein H6709_16455 [Kofleriaceae bacterium]|nr:hypothetical protein [Kofleriaceae bacterium]
MPSDGCATSGSSAVPSPPGRSARRATSAKVSVRDAVISAGRSGASRAAAVIDSATSTSTSASASASVSAGAVTS